MRAFNPLVLLTLLVMQSASTQAADLNGAWTIDASACGKMFTKENNKLAFQARCWSPRGRFSRPGKANYRHISKMYCEVVARWRDECASDCVVLGRCRDFRRSIRRENLRRE